MKIITILTSLLLICGCSSVHNFNKYGEIDEDNKTVQVPFGSQGITGDIKKILKNNSWRLKVYRGPKITKGTIGNQTELQEYDSFNTRYRLLVATNPYDRCLDFTLLVRYDISFIDNNTGEEILTMDGAACQPEVVDAFNKSLNSLQPN